MDENPSVSAENTAEVSQPEVTQESSQQNEISQEATSSDNQESSEKPTRSQERIRETIAARKEAERVAERAAQEAAYWRDQALKGNQNPKPQELEGVTEEGIDPQKFAQSLREQIMKEVKEQQGLTAKQQALYQEQLEVSSQPEMADDFFRDYVTAKAKSDDLSPWEAYAVAKERFSESLKTSAKQARDEAGKFVKESTQTPTPRNSNSQPDNVYTRDQLSKVGLDGGMTVEEYQKNLPEIQRQMRAGLIK